jgi:hypothetical protein
MYECGLGYKNSAGFGMVEASEKRKSMIDRKNFRKTADGDGIPGDSR